MSSFHGKSLTQGAAFPRVIPFALFMAFIGLDEGLRFLIGKGLVGISTSALYFLYPVKALSVATVLLRLLPRYHEINLRDLAKFGHIVVSIVIGLAVFILCVGMDWRFA